MPYRNPPPVERSVDEPELIALCEAYIRAVAATNEVSHASRLLRPSDPAHDPAMRAQAKLIAEEERLSRRIAASRAHTPEGWRGKARAAQAWYGVSEGCADQCAIARSLVADLARHGGRGNATTGRRSGADQAGASELAGQ